MFENALVEVVTLKSISNQAECEALRGIGVQFSIPGIIQLLGDVRIFGVFQYIFNPTGKRLIHRCFKPWDHCQDESALLKHVLSTIATDCRKRASTDLVPADMLFWGQQKDVQTRL